MPAGQWNLHDDAIYKIGSNEVDLANDAIEARLYTSTSNVTDLTVGDATTLTGELSGNGYTAQSITSTWTQNGAQSEFSTDEPVFSPNGGDLTAQLVALIDTTHTPHLVIAHAYLSLISDSPVDVTIQDGLPLRVKVPTAVFTLGRAA